MAAVRGRGTSWDSGYAELLPRGHRVGDWVVTEPIGAGGWATVYAGRPATADDDRDREGDGPPPPAEVALKVMPTAGLAPLQARRVAEAARREVELGRAAGHPRLVRLLDSLVLRAPGQPSLDGAIVLVMERARCSLRDLLDAGVTEAERARLVVGVCEGLAHLHGAGWVHTDLKPENVLIGADGSVKLSDFGLATELTGTHGYAPPMGTLDYLPPERWKAPLGELGVEVRPSADIWALGILVHEVFASGASPFPGATPMARGAAAQEYAEGRAPLRLDQAVPEFWRALAADCLAPAHASRAAHTARSLIERIGAHEAAGGGDQAARNRTGPLPLASPTGLTARAGRRRRRIGAAFLAATACAALGAAIWSSTGREADPARSDGAGGGPARVRVFNAERGCQGRTDRDPQCSLGLAIDPGRPYTAENVVPTRVWHGDVLVAECEVPQGQTIIDEEDLASTRWFRVRLPPTAAQEAGEDGREGVREAGRAAPGTTAWLPAVRTKDRPALPPCPRPAPTP
ncbi:MULTISPECIES: serine/threonine-protein kinase [unclassified Streptomyces]|uniref:serine/threonine-protein kinase n=1 Tax=unclassified Streptomyces TaxID=2593676 RepID=UPI0006F75408|nr:MULTISPECIES: serine/threonine-protein kinase [unclassified Streptomyces]KQX56282.1 serine/threonine protein kinase [Streptomyces sp. Root1304]KRA97097.1 serine/threonine protein kinase [Streptomyces sp. Root66D1]